MWENLVARTRKKIRRGLTTAESGWNASNTLVVKYLSSIKPTLGQNRTEQENVPTQCQNITQSTEIEPFLNNKFSKYSDFNGTTDVLDTTLPICPDIDQIGISTPSILSNANFSDNVSDFQEFVSNLLCYLLNYNPDRWITKHLYKQHVSISGNLTYFSISRKWIQIMDLSRLSKEVC